MMLELRDIYKTYLQGKLEVPVLNGISLSVEEGEYLAIMGPSGSGKTTLMNIIGCLDNPTSGDYILDGENIARLSEKRMSEVRLHSIGFVFQSFYLLSKQSALENVALPLLYAGVRRRDRLDIARQALERVGLGDRTDFTPTQLSGGQCQRVAIARAIVNNPKILLADEPTGALDTRSGEQIMEIFKRLNQEGVTVVMITHEREIAAHARRILHIRDGLLVRGNGKPFRQPPQAAPAGPMKETVSVSPPENIKVESTAEAAPLPEALAAEPAAPKSKSEPKWLKPLLQAIPVPSREETAAQEEARDQAPEPEGASEPEGKPAPERESKPEETPELPGFHPDEEPISGQTIIAALQRQIEQRSGQEAAREEGSNHEQ